MCLIFLKKKTDKLLKHSWVKEVWDRNNDGWGFTYLEDGVVNVYKGLWFEDFWKEFSVAQKMDVDVLVHMRMATQGNSKYENVHPFEIGNTGIYFMHNGMVDYPDMEEDSYYMGAGYGNGRGYYSWSDKSDTNQFAEKFLAPMLEAMEDPKAFIRTETFNWIINKAGGRGNMFAFTDDRGHTLIDLPSWKRTTRGMLVSNHYAFTTDKPTLGVQTPKVVGANTSEIVTSADGKALVVDRSGCWREAMAEYPAGVSADPTMVKRTQIS